MKNYLKLVNFEVNRFFKLYLILIGLTILSQLIGAWISQTYMKNAKQMMAEKQLSMNQYKEQYGTFSFDQFTDSEWFLLPIFLYRHADDLCFLYLVSRLVWKKYIHLQIINVANRKNGHLFC